MARAGALAEISERLRERRSEIEEGTLARVKAVSDPAKVDDPEYALGLRDAVGVALDYAIASIETSRGRQTAVPAHLLMQARAAARNGVSLDTVLCRYSAGYTLLGDYLIEAAEVTRVSSAELRRALRAQAAVYDRLINTISAEYSRDAERRARTSGQRRAQLVRMLLAGDPVDPADLRYSLEGWHLAILASGPGAVEALRSFAATLDREHLLVQIEENTVWIWLGGRSPLSTSEVLGLLERDVSAQISLALGEPGWGIDGWRLTHRQAKAAMSVSQRGLAKRVRYADVALLASALRDDVLASSLRDIYLAPLEGGPDRGEAMCRTLNAYFATGCNASSTSAKLGVSRQTVNRRLRGIEERIGRPLDDCTAEMQLALRLREVARVVPTSVR
jgi:hypothetical protein